MVRPGADARPWGGPPVESPERGHAMVVFLSPLRFVFCFVLQRAIFVAGPSELRVRRGVLEDVAVG